MHGAGLTGGDPLRRRNKARINELLREQLDERLGERRERLRVQRFIGGDVALGQARVLLARGVGLGQTAVVHRATRWRARVKAFFDLAETRRVRAVHHRAIRLSELHRFGERLVRVLAQKHRRVLAGTFGEVLVSRVRELRERELRPRQHCGDISGKPRNIGRRNRALLVLGDLLERHMLEVQLHEITARIISRPRHQSRQHGVRTRLEPLRVELR